MLLTRASRWAAHGSGAARVAVAAVFLLDASAGPASGQCEISKLLASDGAANDDFGFAVAISGDALVVGAQLDADNGPWSGSAYVFRYNPGVSQWVEEAKLLASDGEALDAFGVSVGISGDFAIVGAYSDDDNGLISGSAYVYRFDRNLSAWVEQAKLLASDGAPGDWFGKAVAISGDVAIVGAPADDDNGDQSGSAYVFRFNGSSWIEEAKLLASDGAATDFFGNSLAVDGNVVIVGAFGHDDNGTSSGAAYVYRFDMSIWGEQAKIVASDSGARDGFGESVAIRGGIAIVGAPGGDGNEVNGGSAYVYRYDPESLGWAEEAKLFASDGVPFASFGRAVAVSDDVAIVGAFEDLNNDSETGSAYLYRFDGSTWVEESKLLASDGAAFDRFGISVAVSGDVAILGAPGSGSAYVATCEGPPCLTDINADGSVNVPDLLFLLAAWGTNPGGPPDFDGDGVVAVPDLLQLLANWGPCP